jgi:hypothetical protein
MHAHNTPRNENFYSVAYWFLGICNEIFICSLIYQLQLVLNFTSACVALYGNSLGRQQELMKKLAKPENLKSSHANSSLLFITLLGACLCRSEKNCARPI